MNKDNAKQLLPFVQALADGKTIQINRGSREHPKWVDWSFDTCPSINFDAPIDYYHIKPTKQSRKVWVNVYPEGSRFGGGTANTVTHFTKDSADKEARSTRLACVEVVLEWETP